MVMISVCNHGKIVPIASKSVWSVWNKNAYLNTKNVVIPAIVHVIIIDMKMMNTNIVQVTILNISNKTSRHSRPNINSKNFTILHPINNTA